MRLNMWLIADRLEHYSPSCDIRDGNAHISGVRLFREEATEFDPQYIYVFLDSKALSDSLAFETTTLVNGRDIIMLQRSDANNVINDLLAAFDFYNSGEAALWEESAQNSFQRIVDLGNSVLGNPMMLSDFDGNVLAMSSVYREEDINEFWVEARNTGSVPTSILGAPMQTSNGKTVSTWSGEPRMYVMPDGTKTIGVFLSAEGEDIAGFSLWEHENPIRPGDIWLIKTLCTVLVSMTGKGKRSPELRSNSAFIGDLLAGVEIDTPLTESLELTCAHPWQLLVIDNPFRSDIIHKRGIVHRLRNHAIPCIPLIFDNTVVILVSQKNAAALLDSLLGVHERQYYLAGLSLPFDDLRTLSIRYRQTLFTLTHAQGKPGIYYSVDYAFDYLLSLVDKEDRKQGLLHPALEQLKQHDADKQADLYETLYHYLLNERSILLGSQALHIHRNSFMYRLNRIKKLFELDLDDPKLRAYLLLSFFLDKAR